MSSRHGQFIWTVSIALAVFSAASCRGEVSAPDESDALARDRALEREILLANQAAALADEARRNGTDTAAAEEPDAPAPPVPTAAEVQAILEPPAPPTPARAELNPAVVVAERSQVSMRPSVVVAPRRVASRPVDSVVRPREGPSTPVDEAPASAPSEDSAPPEESSFVTVPEGTDFALEAGRRVCHNSSNVGDRFTGRLTRGLPGIPSGSRASVVITSLVGPYGEEDFALDVRSLSVDGRTYSIDSRVRRIELDRTRGAYRCIPDGGIIRAELTGSLRVRQ